MIFIRRTWLLIGLLVIATVFCIRPVNDIDVQWHLKIGQWMLDHHQVVTDDFYSVSKWGREWTSVPWLYQCILAWLVRHVGWMGPTIWQWLVALAITLQTSFLIWLYRDRRVRCDTHVSRFTFHVSSWDWQWPALSIPAALGVLETIRICEVRFQHRPEMTTHVLLGTYLIILTLWRRRNVEREPQQQRLTWFLWCLPVLQLWWANTHGVFALGPIIVWTFLGCEILTAFVSGQLHKRGRALLNLTAVGIAVVIACFISPYGSKTGLYPLHLYYVLTAPEYKYGIAEALPISLAGMWRAGGWNLLLLAEWMLAGVGVIAVVARAWQSDGRQRLLYGFSRLDLGYLLACAGMFYISLTAIRNIPLFHIVAAPLMVLGLQTVIDVFGGLISAVFIQLQVTSFKCEVSTWVSCIVRVAFALLLILLYRSIVSGRYYERFHGYVSFGFGQSDHIFPIAGLDFLERNTTNMARMAMLGDTKSADMFLNRFGPEWPTYIDGRHAEVYDAPFFAAYGATLGLRGAFFTEAGKYGVGIALFGTESLGVGSADLQKDIYEHPGWRLIYLDDCACIFVADVPSNRALIARCALPPAPAAMDEQESVYRAWLDRCGRSRYDLYEPRNGNMLTSRWSRALVSALQLGVIWKPRMNRTAWQQARVASLLSKLGWSAVADNIYEKAITEGKLNKDVAEEAINHAIVCCEACETPEAKAFFLARVQNRAAALEKEDPRHPAAQYGLAYAEDANGHYSAAITRLETLKSRHKECIVLDLLARVYGELGDTAATQSEKEQIWRKAVKAWRERLTRYPTGPGTFRAYLRLGDLFQRLNMPLQARANYVCALNEPDIPPPIAERAREHVCQLEERLFGVSFVPLANRAAVTNGPFSLPSGLAPEPAMMFPRAGGVPLGQPIIPGALVPAQPRELQQQEKLSVYRVLDTNAVERILPIR